MTVRILQGDALTVLKTLLDESVQCCVTSPPYWGLRDYSSEGQLGLEPTPEEHVAAMVAVFREVRRVLRKDGTLWLNYGDSYASSVNGRPAADIVNDDRTFRDKPFNTAVGGLKPKDLVGMPWRVAFALQADGWWLRQDIIWAKPNPMPESVTDRCTKAHEYIFLLSKSPRYYFDAEAIAEESETGDLRRPYGSPGANMLDPRGQQGNGSLRNDAPGTRNRRSVWTIATAPFSQAHFATFPPDLVEPCIKAGTSEKGCCGQCGAPCVRVVERQSYGDKSGPGDRAVVGMSRNSLAGQKFYDEEYVPPRTVGWQPSCSCAAPTKPCVVLDPFFGAGTTGLVSDRLGRDCIGIELNPEYAAMARARIQADAGLFAQVAE